MTARGDTLSTNKVAEFLDMTPENLRMKLTGKIKFSLPESFAIRDRFFPNFNVDYLFADNDMTEIQISSFGREPNAAQEYPCGHELSVDNSCKTSLPKGEGSEQ
jgi:hypothetical protein